MTQQDLLQSLLIVQYRLPEIIEQAVSVLLDTLEQASLAHATGTNDTDMLMRMIRSVAVLHKGMHVGGHCGKLWQAVARKTRDVTILFALGTMNMRQLQTWQAECPHLQFNTKVKEKFNAVCDPVIQTLKLTGEFDTPSINDVRSQLKNGLRIILAGWQVLAPPKASPPAGPIPSGEIVLAGSQDQETLANPFYQLGFADGFARGFASGQGAARASEGGHPNASEPWTHTCVITYNT